MTLKSKEPNRSAPPGVSPIAYPLDEFYAQAGRALPKIEAVPAEAMPEPYKSLLVHTSDMTSTLENFHRDTIHLRPIHRQERGDVYFREVLLVLDQSEKVVEYGAIKIYLNAFPPVARREILEERIPLGNILNRNKIGYASRPKAFFRVKADSYILGGMELKKPQWLYGRRNSLFDPGQKSLAEIVEILPPSAA